MLLTALALSAFHAFASDVTQPAELHNAGNGNLGIRSTLSPVAGEEGQWTAVRFYAQHDLSVATIDATFVRQPAGPTWDTNCVVDLPHDVVVFASASPTPPTDPVELYRTTIAPIANHPGGRAVAHLVLPEPIFVPRGEHLYVAFELPGAWPDVTCLMLSENQEDQPVYEETDFWSFATTAPFAWTGLDALGLPEKPVVSITGTWLL